MSLVFKAVEFDPFASQASNVPVTEPQSEIWASVKIGGDEANCGYNESVSLRLKGNLNADALKKAAHSLMMRHDALRSTFSPDGNTLWINENAEVKFEVTDYSNSDKKESLLGEFLKKEVNEPLDLEKGPLIRFRLLKLAQDDHCLIITAHHIICDGWSVSLVMIDLGKFYSEFVTGVKQEIEPAVSFASFANEQQQLYRSEEYKQIEKYWLKQFEGQLPVMELPLNKQRPPVRTFNAHRLDYPMEMELFSSLKRLATQQGVSFVTMMVASFEIFLHRITSQEDIVVGISAAGQSLEGKYNLVGHCVNFLPLRSFIKPEEKFSEYLLRRKKDIFDAYEYQQYTFGSLIQKLSIPRDPSRIPLVPVGFNVDMGIADGVKFHGIEAEFHSNPRYYDNFEMSINAAGSKDKFILELTFNTDLFTIDSMKRRMDEYIELLKGIVADSSKKIFELPILPAAERKMIFEEWNSNESRYDHSKCIHHLIEDQVKKTPDAIAIEANGKKISYKELNSKADHLAQHLISLGVKPETLVAVFLERTPDLIVALLGILKSGGAYVGLDPMYPLERMKFILDDTKAPVLITTSDLQNKLPEFNGKKLLMDSLPQSSSGVSSAPSIPSSLAYLIYTSGSTGKPKGVAIEHRNTVALLHWGTTILDADDVKGCVATASICFDSSVFEIFYPLTVGGKVILVKNALDILSLPKESGVTLMNMVPSAMAELINVPGAVPETTRVINLGGEPLSQSLVEKIYSQTKIKKLHDFYGPSECTTNTIYSLRKPGGKNTIGRPVANTKIYILDSYQQPVPVGISGEIYIGGAQVGRGYYNRPELTAEKFLNDPFNSIPGAKMYRTGDLAKYYDDGSIEYLSRIDNQVKVRGYRIELGEIEFVLQSHPSVKEAAVIVREDMPGEKLLVAYVALNNDVKEELKNFLKQKLPDYMNPSVYVWMDSLPQTPNKKVDRKALPKPETVFAPSSNFVEPDSPVEEMLCSIWCDVLGVDRISATDNFFDLGGHSLLGVRMLTLVEERLGVKLPLPSVFRASTIEQLAKLISNEELTTAWPIIVPLQPEGTKEPLFCIHMHNGNIHRWRNLLKFLNKERPVIAIQPRGLDVKKEPHYRIEEMASFYIEEIKKVQPTGPYHLLGQCFGAMVAYEMSVQLKRMGEEVNFTGMINTYAPPANELLYKIKLSLKQFGQKSFSEKISFVFRLAGSVVNRITGKFGNNAPQQSSSSPQQTDIRDIHSWALVYYKPGHYDGNILLIQIGEPIEDFYNEQMGWDRLVSGKLDIAVIHGSDNESVITEDKFVEKLAEVVNRHLELTQTFTGKQKSPAFASA